MNPELHNFSHGSSNATGHFISIAAAMLYCFCVPFYSASSGTEGNQ